MEPTGRRVLLTGGHPLAGGLARGLAARGDRVVMVAPAPGPPGGAGPVATLTGALSSEGRSPACEHRR